MAAVARFHPHRMSDADVRALATGRENLLRQALDLVEANRRTTGAPQHLLLVGPRGSGKSFLLRWIEVELARLPDGPPFVLLPEDVPHLASPEDVLRELTRSLEARPAQVALPRWSSAPGSGWNEELQRLDAAITASSTGVGRAQVVIGVEDLDALLAQAFAKPADRSRLRRFLTERSDLMWVAASRRGELDRDYDDRLFYSFVQRRLQPWTSAESLHYLARRRAHADRPEDPRIAPRLTALHAFLGGNPRNTAVLVDLALREPAMSASALLEALLDELAPTYQELADRIPAKARLLFDALLRGGEPCSQSELAERLGTTQNRIAQHFAWLRGSGLVRGERVPGSRASSYRVVDRLFAHHQRMRTPRREGESATILALLDLLEAVHASVLDPAASSATTAAGVVLEHLANADRAGAFGASLGFVNAQGTTAAPRSAGATPLAFAFALLRGGAPPSLFEDVAGELAAPEDALLREAFELFALAARLREDPGAIEAFQAQPDLETAARSLAAAIPAHPTAS